MHSVLKIAQNAKLASKQLSQISTAEKNAVLINMAKAIRMLAKTNMHEGANRTGCHFPEQARQQLPGENVHKMRRAL